MRTRTAKTFLAPDGVVVLDREPGRRARTYIL